jgi:Uma2 family endonuclease
MTAAKRREPLDWRVYLEGEGLAERKHEYVGGFVYAMAGGVYLHSLISTNTTTALGKRLGDGSCRVLNSDFKIRVRTESGFNFYYPDCSVVCTALERGALYVDDPVVVVEVASRSTRRIDEGEKRESYLSLPSIGAYLLIDSEQLRVTVWRRCGSTFDRELYVEETSSVPLPEIGVELPLAEVYANVEWPPLSERSEEPMA